MKRILLELPMFIIVEEFGFYYSHILLHSKLLYKSLHKIHHEWTAPVGLAALYAHPLEHILSNLLPIALGPLLLGSHLLTAWLWYVVALVGTWWRVDTARSCHSMHLNVLGCINTLIDHECFGT